jgi:hypothetical protein
MLVNDNGAMWWSPKVRPKTAQKNATNAIPPEEIPDRM